MIAIGKEIGRAGHDALWFGVPVFHIHQDKPVGIGVGQDAHNLPYNECFGVPPIAKRFDGGHFQPS